MTLSIRVEATPNENSLKFVLDRPLEARSKYFASPEEAAAHPLAKALFEIGDVASVMISANFVSVNKRPEASWPELISTIQDVIKKELALP